ncbi:MAG TPA: dienelactone hydrolase family protein [Minicystis sp.]|nr:dienelactone hydrolase family protein [Minicystis sp.]
MTVRLACGSFRRREVMMSVSTVELPTEKGRCATDIVTPGGDGPFRVVLFCVDAGGRRPAMTEMAERIARMGYLVAIPDLFHQSGSPWDLLPPGPHTLARIGELFGEEKLRAKFMRDYMGVALSLASLDAAFRAVFAHLDTRADVRKGKVGITGYCMGGNAALRVAEAFPDRIGAVASFHGGGIASEAPDSPHLGVSKLRAEVYVAGAIEDASFDEAAKARLVAALEAAGVKHEVETYPARHGFAVHDHAAAYDAAAAERHYAALERLYARAL